ncbi:MAG: hypothetical protein NTX28_10165 [Novosphingobium sp.]|nr:hypothetical protein [Novosphingobium sp.]
MSCAHERSSERTLTGRWKCGPSGRYFESNGIDLPMRGMTGTVIIDEAAAFPRVHDTVADSDGDDGA